MEKIYTFAKDMLDKFNSNASYAQILYSYTLEDLKELGLNSGKNFFLEYTDAINSFKSLYSIIEKIEDPYLLGNAIYLRLRYFKKYSKNPESILENENRKWFLLVLNRMCKICLEKDEDKAILGEIEKIREELLEELFHFDMDKLKVGNEIESLYVIRYGETLCKIFELTLNLNTLKYKARLVEESQNTGCMNNLKAIDEIIQKEKVKNRKMHEDMVNKLKEISNRIFLSPEFNIEINSRYRRIVKMIHPELNLRLSNRARELYTRAKKGYADLDVLEIRSIEEEIYVNTGAMYENDKQCSLLEEKEILEDNLKRIKAKREAIFDTYPFYLMHDLRKLERTSRKLRGIIGMLFNQIVKYEAIIAKLLDKEAEYA